MKKLLLILGLGLLSLGACVSKKKFTDLNNRKSALEADKLDCEENLKKASAINDSLSKLLKESQNHEEMLLVDVESLKLKNKEQEREIETLSNSYEKLAKSHSRLQNYSAAEADKLTKDLMKREKELQDAEQKNKVLQTNLQEREAKVKELEKILADKEKAVNDLKNRVNNALLGFKDKDMSINIKNGKVYVSLSEQLLFKSGSTEVDPVGQEALKKLAGALKDQQDVSVMVEGHTDDVPMKGAVGIKDNWDLSVLRATAITRILQNNGVDPKNIMPAGKGQYTPLVEAKTPEARKQNRRTEIILTPKLDELFKLLNDN